MNPLNPRIAALWVLVKGPSFGSELTERLRALGFEISEGTLYPGLKDLERRRLVSARDVPAPRGGRARRYYQLTAAGLRFARSSQKVAREALSKVGVA